jgi:hypothetical protein
VVGERELANSVAEPNLNYLRMACFEAVSKAVRGLWPSRVRARTTDLADRELRL